MHMRDNWLSKLLPEVLAKFLRRAERSIEMYHTVPSIVANTKQRAEVFKKNWDYYIGKSELTYCRNDEGKQYVEEIRKMGLGPKNSIHRKDVYL